MELVAEDTSIPRVLELTEDGEGDDGPNIDVEANQSRSIPDMVDGEVSEGPEGTKPELRMGKVGRGALHPLV